MYKPYISYVTILSEKNLGYCKFSYKFVKYPSSIDNLQYIVINNCFTLLDLVINKCFTPLCQIFILFKQAVQTSHSLIKCFFIQADICCLGHDFPYDDHD